MRDFERRLIRIEGRMLKKNYIQFSDLEMAAKLQHLLARESGRTQTEMTLQDKISHIGIKGWPFKDTVKTARLKHILTIAAEREAKAKG